MKRSWISFGFSQNSNLFLPRPTFSIIFITPIHPVLTVIFRFFVGIKNEFRQSKTSQSSILYINEFVSKLWNFLGKARKEVAELLHSQSSSNRILILTPNYFYFSYAFSYVFMKYKQVDTDMEKKKERVKGKANWEAEKKGEGIR